ncbi:MAG: response regulator [Armatimonadota bacterium]|jgi:response regulator NasT
MPGSRENGQKPERPRVLVVEDEFVILLTLKVQLEAIGCDVVGTARDADSAVEQARSLQPDIVLMDIGLPGKDGAAATREIMADRWTRIILVTAYGDERVEQAVQAGACVVLTKPIVQAQLARAIDQAQASTPGSACG